MGKKFEELKDKEQFMDDSNMEFKNDAYYVNEEGPYCSCCFDCNYTLVKMHQKRDNDKNIGYNTYICPKCKTTIFIED